jgi:lactate dehydrogenase-like 2-hydroxyacid dehydrogenase
MSSKPPVFVNASNFLVPGLREGLEGAYELRDRPGPGIRAVATDGTRGLDARTMTLLPDLEMIAVCAVGYDQVDIAAAKARGILVTNTPDVLTEDVADIAIGLMIAVHRQIAAQDAYVRHGGWAAHGAPPLSRRLTGRRIGILGLGRIGLAIADRAAPFAGEIAYHTRSPRADSLWRYADSPVALAASVDILVVATPGGAETRHLVDSAVIDALGPEGVLINIARGSVVDEDALVTALVEGRLGGAGLDVFADEPQVPEALLALEKVVLLPHQGSATIETRTAMGRLVLDNLAAFFAGEPLLSPVV